MAEVDVGWTLGGGDGASSCEVRRGCVGSLPMPGHDGPRRATSVRQVRHDQKGLGPTQSDTGSSGSRLNPAWNSGGYYSVANGTGPIPNETHSPPVGHWRHIWTVPFLSRHPFSQHPFQNVGMSVWLVSCGLCASCFCACCEV